jgi:hypothetical protein
MRRMAAIRLRRSYWTYVDVGVLAGILWVTMRFVHLPRWSIAPNQGSRGHSQQTVHQGRTKHPCESRDAQKRR